MCSRHELLLQGCPGYACLNGPRTITARLFPVVVRAGKPFSVMRFTVFNGRIAGIDVETSAERQIAVNS